VGFANVKRREFTTMHGQRLCDFTAGVRCDCGLPLDAEMESCPILIAEGYFAFKHLAQSGGKTKDQQIQRQNRQQYLAHHAVFSAYAVPIESVRREEGLRANSVLFSSTKGKF
jgi:hypothetical protein